MLACSSTVENLVALGIMGVGLPVSFILAGKFSDRVIRNQHPAPISDQAFQSGCFILLVVTFVLWMGVCFPFMRFVLWLVCDTPFGWN